MTHYMENTKLSAIELMARSEAAKHNSDLQNLVTAKISIKNTRKQLLAFANALTAELNEVDIELETMISKIENDEIQDVRDVKKLYEKTTYHKARFDDFAIIL